MNAPAWFGLGFLLASIAMWAITRVESSAIRLDNKLLLRRARLAEEQARQATDRAVLSEQWSQMLGASLYGEAKDVD